MKRITSASLIAIAIASCTEPDRRIEYDPLVGGYVQLTPFGDPSGAGMCVFDSQDYTYGESHTSVGTGTWSRTASGTYILAGMLQGTATIDGDTLRVVVTNSDNFIPASFRMVNQGQNGMNDCGITIFK